MPCSTAPSWCAWCARPAVPVPMPIIMLSGMATLARIEASPRRQRFLERFGKRCSTASSHPRCAAWSRLALSAGARERLRPMQKLTSRPGKLAVWSCELGSELRGEQMRLCVPHGGTGKLRRFAPSSGCRSISTNASSSRCSGPRAAARPRCCACSRVSSSRTQGRILLDGRGHLAGVPPHRRPVNMMFQSYALFPHLTVEGNVAFGLKQDGLPKAEIAARVDEMLALVKLDGFGAPQAAPAFRRPAPARRARPRARQAAAGAAARRAAVGARPQAARGDAVRADGAAGQARTDLRHRHPRPGGGDDGRRPHRRDERRPAGPGRARRPRSTSSRTRAGSPTSSATST